MSVKIPDFFGKKPARKHLSSVYPINLRRLIVILYDASSIFFCLWLAFQVRFDFRLGGEFEFFLKKSLPWVFLIQFSVFSVFGLYRGLWAFASLHDLVLILRAVIIATLACVTGVYLEGHQFLGWPRSIFPLDAVFLLLALGGGRFVYRYARDFIFSNHSGDLKRILIIGAGKTGAMISKEITSNRNINTKIVGFLDDKKELKGSRIQNAPVRGSLKDLKDTLRRTRADEVIIAIPGLRGEVIKEIITAAQEASVYCRIVPDIRNILSSKLGQNLRRVEVEDLLRRDPVIVDDQGLKDFFQGKSVLITGAGGSIGTELSRQATSFGPAKIIFFERSEFNLYKLEREIRSKIENGDLPEMKAHFILGDVLDQRKLKKLFDEHHPEIVIHAAAYKHVPLIEENPDEGVKNNILGTYRVVEAAAQGNAKTFVLVSTDKAVRPTSIMGATKRVAEMVVNAVGSKSNLRTLAVRFGNVLDSDGSVLPLFRAQIQKGGPVTVTHPEMTRYFMTIPEAASLVLQASLLGRGGEVFLLDMGAPVKIADLAEDLIRLSGLLPHKDIEIKFTGLRKGEKLYEELLVDTKNARATSHPKIWMAQSELEGALPENWDVLVKGADLETLSYTKARHLIQSWVPDYQDDPQENESTKQATTSSLTH